MREAASGTTVANKVHVIGVMAYDRDHREMLDAVAEGKFKGLEDLITRRIGLEDFVEKGIRALIHEKDQHGSRSLLSLICSVANKITVKILVHPSQREPPSYPSGASSSRMVSSKL